ANLAPETEREHIRIATEIITRCIGSRPEGWYSRYAPSLSTRAILLDAGYSYDSDAYDDELPYWVKVDSRDQLVIPYSLVHNDVRFSRQGITTGNDYFDYIKRCCPMRDRRGSAADAQLRTSQPHHWSSGS